MPDDQLKGHVIFINTFCNCACRSSAWFFGWGRKPHFESILVLNQPILALFGDIIDCEIVVVIVASLIETD